MNCPWSTAALKGAAVLIRGVAVAMVLVGCTDEGPAPAAQPAPSPPGRDSSDRLTSAHGSGSFDGAENLPTVARSTNERTQCTELVATTTDHLVHEVRMTGLFYGRPGDGKATFTQSSPSYRNPEGTYADPECRRPTSLTGTMTVEFGSHRCSGTGTYEHRKATNYTMSFDGACDDATTAPAEATATKIRFSGVQTGCPRGCGPGHPPGVSSRIAGTYDQS